MGRGKDNTLPHTRVQHTITSTQLAFCKVHFNSNAASRQEGGNSASAVQINAKREQDNTLLTRKAPDLSFKRFHNPLSPESS